jgi:hypothetical protein
MCEVLNLLISSIVEFNVAVFSPNDMNIILVLCISHLCM